MLDVPRRCDPVLARELVGDADAVGPVVLLVQGRAAQVRRVERGARRGVVVVAGEQVLIAEHAVRRKEPELVLKQRTPEGDVGVVGPPRLVDQGQAPVAQFLREVVGDQALAGVVGAEQAGKDIAAVLRDHVGLEAAVLELRGLTTELHARFLRGRRIEVEAAALAFPVELHAVEQRAIVCRAAAVNDRIRVHRIDVAADVLRRRRNHHAHRDFGEPAHLLGDRQREQHLGRHCFDLRRVLHVDDRALPADRQRFFECPDFHLGVDLRGETRLQFDGLALDDAETGQCEGHGIGAWTEVDDFVFAVLVGHRCPDLLDQGRARGFHRHSRHHAARRVSHHANDARRQRLRKGIRRQAPHRRDHADSAQQSGHRPSPRKNVRTPQSD